jgi:hypothetical protein
MRHRQKGIRICDTNVGHVRRRVQLCGAPEELAIDNAKEQIWMSMYEHDSDTLEDILY